MRTRVLLLEGVRARDEARDLLADAVGRPLLVVRIEHGTAGVPSDYTADSEIIRIGYPPASRHPFFQVERPQPGIETCVDVVLGRTVFGRSVRDVVCFEPDLAPMLAHALAGHDVRCWLEATPRRPEELSANVPVPEAGDLVAALLLHREREP
ncbi:MAG: hypothetical protein KF858_07230 [Candidatus Sumerlaeia bacterium]|nr:hypothetical protein [Candidatus Sumerlaeia bacterium]